MHTPPNRLAVRRSAFWALVAALTLLPAACREEDHDLGDPDGGDVATDVPRDPTPLVDLLLVVDNSGSMAQEQQSLSAALPEFLGTLFDQAEARGLVADVHVGVVSTDMGTMGYAVSTCADAESGDDGCLLNDPSPSVTGCAADYPRYLERTSGDPAYSTEVLAHDIACLATLGTSGCGFEQQLEAARRAAVDNALGCNAGFFRPGSVVAVLLVTDEDDCSVDPAFPEMFDPAMSPTLGHLNIRCSLHPEMVHPVDFYADAFADLEAAGHLVVLGVVAGVPPDGTACEGFGDRLAGCLSEPAMIPSLDPADPTNLVPSCNTTMGLAFPPVRLVELAQRFGPRAFVTSICRADYKSPLAAFASRIAQTM